MKSLPLIYSAITTYIIGSVAAYAQPLKSGAYGNSLLIAINSKEHNVSGKFGSSGGYLTAEGWDCNFYFSGKTQNNGSARIVAISLKSKKNPTMMSTSGIIIPGRDPNDAVIIKLDDDLSGCARGEDLLEQEPSPRNFNALRASLEPLELRERRDGFEYRIISAKKSYFYQSAQSKDPRKSYVRCGDIVMVTAKEEATDRVKATYYGKKENTAGWLLKKDVLGIGEQLTCQ